MDFEQGEVHPLLDLDSEKPPCFLLAYGEKLLYTYSGVLYIYDTQNGALEEKPLSDEQAYNLSLSGDVLAIGYTSILSLEDSRIELYDLKEKKSICQFEHPGSILQIEMARPWNGKVYVLGYDDLNVYRVKEDTEKGTEETEAEVLCTLPLEPENSEYCGGFVLME